MHSVPISAGFTLLPQYYRHWRPHAALYYQLVDLLLNYIVHTFTNTKKDLTLSTVSQMIHTFACSKTPQQIIVNNAGVN